MITNRNRQTEHQTYRIQRCFRRLQQPCCVDRSLALEAVPPRPASAAVADTKL